MDELLLCLIPLPRGRWLGRERARLGLGRPQVAAAIHRHSQAVAAIERSNGVLPPGWLDPLRALGLEFFDPVWPRNLPPYRGTTWAHEIATRIGFRHSPFRWSRHLGVHEDEVRTVLQSDQPVPSTWLLKLAELGLDVPERVRDVLVRSASPNPQTPTAREPVAHRVPTPDRATEPGLVSATWTNEGALSIQIAAPVFAQMPASVHELLTLVLQSTGLGAAPVGVNRSLRASE